MVVGILEGIVVKEWFAGLDIHMEMLYGTVLNKQGEIIVQGSLPNSKLGIQSFFAGLSSSKLVVAIEACGLWRGAYNMLTELGYDVVLANPLKTHQIAVGKKTDKVDSRILADLLRTGYLPLVYIPGEDVLKLRDIARHRARLVRVRTSLQSKIKSHLNQSGLKFKKGWSRKNLEYLKTLDPLVASFVHVIEVVSEEIKKVTSEINRVAGSLRLACLLQTVPGIGRFGSLMILGEIGDIKRFPSPKSLVSYAGLCPGVHRSGDRCFGVVNQSCNRWLKWIMVECSGRAIMMNNQYMHHYHRVKRRKGFKTARRSVARKMLMDIWCILSREEPFKAS
mgnify:CR=1 FL=1